MRALTKHLLRERAYYYSPPRRESSELSSAYPSRKQEESVIREPEWSGTWPPLDGTPANETVSSERVGIDSCVGLAATNPRAGQSTALVRVLERQIIDEMQQFRTMSLERKVWRR